MSSSPRRNVCVDGRPIRAVSAAVRFNAVLGPPLVTLPMAHRRSENTLNKRALGLSVFLLRDTHCQISFQVVIGRGQFRMSTEMVAKREVADPKVASCTHTMHMKGTRSESRFPEVPSVGKWLFVLVDVFVTRRFECWNPIFNLDQDRDTNHDVDYGLGPKARNRGAPDVFDNGFTSREHYCEDAAFFVESARPIRIARHDTHSVIHRSGWSVPTVN
jgi:hypothetical protein